MLLRLSYFWTQTREKTERENLRWRGRWHRCWRGAVAAGCAGRGLASATFDSGWDGPQTFGGDKALFCCSLLLFDLCHLSYLRPKLVRQFSELLRLLCESTDHRRPFVAASKYSSGLNRMLTVSSGLTENTPIPEISNDLVPTHLQIIPLCYLKYNK